MGPAPGSTVRRGPVLWRRCGDVVLVRPRGGDTVELGGTGVALWDELAEPRRLDELVARLAGAHGADEATVAADLDAVLADLAGRGVIDVEP